MQASCWVSQGYLSWCLALAQLLENWIGCKLDSWILVVLGRDPGGWCSTLVQLQRVWMVTRVGLGSTWVGFG